MIPPSKYYFRQQLRNRLYNAVVAQVEASGVSRTEISAAIFWDYDDVVRILSGPSEWTLDIVSDLLFAAGAELDPVIRGIDDTQAGGGFCGPSFSRVAPSAAGEGRGTNGEMS